jgi:hypothetical protein
MQMMTQAYYEEVIFRAGMQVDGGNLTRLPHMDPVSSKSVGSAAWAGRGMASSWLIIRVQKLSN